MTQSEISKVQTENTFYVDFVSEESGVRYQGQFTVRKPTMKDQTAIAGQKTKLLLGGQYSPDNPGTGVDSAAAGIAEALAFLMVCLKKAPEWWNDGDIYETDLLFEIFEKGVVVDPTRFRFVKAARQQQEADGGVGEGSGREQRESNAHDPVASVVD